MNTFPLNFDPEGAGDGRFYRTASGEWILDGGAWQFQGYDENGLLRSQIACKGRQDFYLGHDGGFLIPILQQNWSRHEKSLREIGALVWKERTHSSLSRKQHFQFLLESRSEIDREQQCERYPTGNCQQSGNGDGRAVRSQAQRKL